MRNLQSLPQGWRKVKLGEIAQNFDSKRVPLSSMQRVKMRGEYPYYGAAEIVDYINDYIFDGLYLLIAEDGTVITNGNKPMLQLVNGKFWVNNHAHIIQGKNDLETKYLFYALKNTPIIPYITGAVQLKLTQENLNKIEIPYSEDEELRHRIVNILSAFDEKIELNNKIIKTLEQIAQEIFKEWFNKNSKFKIQNSKLNEFVKTQYGYTESASDKKIGPKFLRVKDINKTDWIDWETVPFCKISDAEYPKYKLKKGDVVIARMADPGKVAIIEEDIDAVFASYLIRLQITSDDITPYFLFYYLRSPLYQNFIFGASTGTTRRSVNARVITDAELTIPPKEKILEFENIVSTIRSKIIANIKENQKLAALRDLLLPKLMSGEIIIKN